EVQDAMERIILDMAYAAHQNPVPFSRHGADEWARQLIPTSPFLHGSIQGINRFFGEVRENPGRAAWRMFLTLIPMTVISWLLMNSDDHREFYNDLPSEARDLYWWFPAYPGAKGLYVTVAKPYEYALPANMLERYMDWAWSEHPNRRKPLEDLGVAVRTSFSV